MRYHDYASVHIPLGSGVTEAACKTVFTQRLKNSGMRWTHDGVFHRRQRKPRKLSKKKEETFWTAYRYIQSRTKVMRYRDYASVHIPLGSGVTEAACKTVFTQRLKNSGMRWSHDGAKTILTLRTILLSRSWATTYLASLTAVYPDGLQPYRENKCYTAIIAA